MMYIDTHEEILLASNPDNSHIHSTDLIPIDGTFVFDSGGDVDWLAWGDTLLTSLENSHNHTQDTQNCNKNQQENFKNSKTQK